MTSEKKQLIPFTLKFSVADRKRMKLLCASEASFNFQYEMFDAAVRWANTYKNKVVAIANPRLGKYNSYYICETLEEIGILETQWNCNSTRALHTAVVCYMNYRDEELFEGQLEVFNGD